MADFTPVEKEVTIRTTSGNRYQKKFFPEVGNTIAVLFVETTQANKAAIAAKVAEITALSVQTKFKKWDAEANEDCIPAVDVRMLVIKDATAPAEPVE
jgi:hypothetical protein